MPVSMGRLAAAKRPQKTLHAARARSSSLHNLSEQDKEEHAQGPRVAFMPSSEQRRKGIQPATAPVSDTCTGPVAAAVAAGNEVGFTGARKCALLLCSAHLCAASAAETGKFPGGGGSVCIPGGQGVAGSNPAVPTGSG